MPKPRDIKLSLIEAKEGSFSLSPVEGFLLRCFRFNPATKTYDIDWAFLIEVVMGSITILVFCMFTWGRSLLRSFRRLGLFFGVLRIQGVEGSRGQV